VPVDDRQIDPFRFVAAELLLERRLSLGSGGEDDQARRVAIDSVNREGTALAARSQVRCKRVGHRWRLALPLEWNRQQARRLVHDDDGVVLVDYGEHSRPLGPVDPSPTAAGSVEPNPDAIARNESACRFCRTHFGVVHENLAAAKRGDGATAGPEPIRRGEVLVEPNSRVRGLHQPAAIGHQGDLNRCPTILGDTPTRMGDVASETICQDGSTGGCDGNGIDADSDL